MQAEEKFWRNRDWIKTRRININRGNWSPQLEMLSPKNVRGKIIVEVGSYITGPVHDFKDAHKIGIEPLIDKFGKYRDDEIIYIKAIGENLPLLSNMPH